MRKTWTWAACLPFVLATAAGAQEKPRAQEKPESQEKTEPPQKAKTPGPRRTVTPLKVQLVFSKYEGEKKLSSLPYTLWVNADDPQRTHLRTGVDVPVPVESKDARIQYTNVGTNIDCRAETLEDGRFMVNLVVEESSLYSADRKITDPLHAPSDVPLFRKFFSTFNVVLRDGQTAQYTTATDPISGDVLKIDATLSVVK